VLTSEQSCDPTPCDLEASRRVDWRFLLPDPRLRQVAYVGPVDSSLANSLRRLSETLKIVSPPSASFPSPAERGGFDLVVVSSRRQSALEIASSLLAEGGYLYWEIDRLSRFRSWRKVLGSEGEFGCLARDFVRDYRRCLRQLGFCDIEVHWHHPDFEHCRKIIPLGDRSAVEFVLSEARRSVPGWAGLVGCRCLAKSGVLQRFVPCISLIACNPDISKDAV